MSCGSSKRIPSNHVSPVIVQPYDEDIFPEVFIPFSKIELPFLSPYILFYDTKLKEKDIVNQFIDEQFNLTRQDDGKPNYYIFPGNIGLDNYVIARNALSFLPIPVDKIKDNRQPDTYRKQEIFTNTTVGLRTRRYLFDGGLQDIATFLTPNAVLYKPDGDFIRYIEYCGNSMDAVQKISIKWNLGDRTMPPITYFNIRDSLLLSFNYTDFMTGSIYTDEDNIPLVIYSRSKVTYDFIDTMVWNPYIIPFTPHNIISAATYIAIRDIINSEARPVVADAGFIGLSKDIVTKFVKHFGYRIFGVYETDELFFMINSVPIDRNLEYRKNQTFRENYIYNHFDGVNVFTPKFTSNLSYLYQDNWTWIQLDRITHTNGMYADYINSSEGLLPPDKDKWKQYLEGVLVNEVQNNFKLVLFEVWNTDTNEVTQRKSVLNSLLRNKEPYIDNPDYIPQVDSKFQPVQIMLRNEYGNVPIFFYSEIRITDIDISAMVSNGLLPQDKDSGLIKPNSYRITLKGNELENYLTIEKLIFVLTVNDIDLYFSVMMPDFLPIKKETLTGLQNAYFVSFGSGDYKYKDYYYTTNRYLSDKAVEYYLNLQIGEDKETFLDNLYNIENSISETFSLYLYKIAPIIDAEIELGLNVTVETDENDNKYNKIELTDTKVKQLNHIVYDRKDYNQLATDIDTRQKNYSNFITHKDEFIDYIDYIDLPSIFAIPEIKITTLTKYYGMSSNDLTEGLLIKLIQGYKKHTITLDTNSRLKINKSELHPAFERLIDTYIEKLKEKQEKEDNTENIQLPELFIQIYPFKWVFNKKLSGKVF